MGTITPLSQGEQLAHIAPNARLVVMKDVGHIPQIEATKKFNDLLLEVVGQFKGDLTQLAAL